MKNYSIYFNLLPLMKCKEKPTKEEADLARSQALKDAQKQFKSLIKDRITAKEIILSKDQPENAVAIVIKEDVLDKVLQQLINMELVSIIDAEYSGPPIPEKPQPNMKRFLK